MATWEKGRGAGLGFHSLETSLAMAGPENIRPAAEISRQARRECWLIDKTISSKRTFRRLETGEEAEVVGFQIELE
jgi:hypothetical protein